MEKQWEFVLGGKFLQGHSRSVHAHRVNEELDMLSWDKVRKCFVLRSFSSSGHVRQFAGKVRQNGRLELETEAWENGSPYLVRAKVAFTWGGRGGPRLMVATIGGGPPSVIVDSLDIRGRIGSRSSVSSAIMCCS